MSRAAASSRVERRPMPSDWPDDAPMTLCEVVAVFSIDYPLPVSTLEHARSALTSIREG